MKRKGLWLPVIALAALLTFSPDALAAVHVGLWFGPPPHRHEVVVVHPGHVHVSVYRGWNQARYVYVPGKWIPGGPPYVWMHGRHYLRHYYRPHGKVYGR